MAQARELSNCDQMVPKLQPTNEYDDCESLGTHRSASHGQQVSTEFYVITCL